jgi:hypothetical protein
MNRKSFTEYNMVEYEKERVDERKREEDICNQFLGISLFSIIFWYQNLE